MPDLCTNDHWCCAQTYDEAEFTPGPRLNLVLAPNGKQQRRTHLTEAMDWAAVPVLLP